MSLTFRCSTNYQKSEVGSRKSVHVDVSHFAPSLINLEVNFRCLDDECIDLPVNNLDLLIRRFNPLDHELILNIRELKGRRSAQAARIFPYVSSKAFQTQ